MKNYIRMNVSELLDDVTRERMGNRPRAEQWQILQVLLEVQREQPVGRMKLMEKVGMTEATVKTVVKRLREAGLVEVDRIGGMYLSKAGEELVNWWKSRFEVLEVDLTTVNWRGNLLRVIGGEKILNKASAVELRDLGVRAGADAVMVAAFRRGQVELPPMTVDEVKPVLKELRELCPQCKDGDLALVTIPKSMRVPLSLSISLQRIM
jgi:predicted transcriptional regulator